jgi:hypothetical protein
VEEIRHSRNDTSVALSSPRKTDEREPSFSWKLEQVERLLLKVLRQRIAIDWPPGGRASRGSTSQVCRDAGKRARGPELVMGRAIKNNGQTSDDPDVKHKKGSARRRALRLIFRFLVRSLRYCFSSSMDSYSWRAMPARISAGVLPSLVC